MISTIKNKLLSSKKFTLCCERFRTLVIDVKSVVFELVFGSKTGRLSLAIIFKLASRNLLHSWSRTAITVGAIASGTAAIVFLVGFAYGLQAIVTNRLIQPNSLRLADVQSSSTALELNDEAIAIMSSLGGIEDISPAMSLAGSLSLNGSKAEVIVVGARNSFLDYSHIELISGDLFSDEAEAKYRGQANAIEDLLELNRGEVAGLTIESELDEKKLGEKIVDKSIRFRINDEVYVPLRSEPKINGSVVGYVRGTIVDSHSGFEVWGSVYESVGTFGKAYQKSTGEWLGRWLMVDSIPVYDEVATGVYLPKNDESNQQVKMTGFLTQNYISILKPEDVASDKIIEALMEEYKNEANKLSESEGKVLGDSTEDENQATSSSQTTMTSNEAISAFLIDEKEASDEASVLKFLFEDDEKEKLASESARSAIVNVMKEDGKEIIISSALLNVWELKIDDVIGKNVSLEYIVSGGLIKGVSGRVISSAMDYKIVGVFKEDDQAMIFTPLSDLESMGINKYTTAKVLSKDSEGLTGLREKIESLGFLTRSIADTLNQVEKLFGVMRFLLGSFGMIAFIVALFGMFNTLTVSLLERTREIGVMKTLGTTDRDIIKLMIAESSLIGVMGGFFGLILGIVIGYGINTITLLFRADSSVSLFAFPVSFLIMVFFMATGVGIITGLYPARRAQKISALNALRYE